MRPYWTRCVLKNGSKTFEPCNEPEGNCGDSSKPKQQKLHEETADSVQAELMQTVRI